MDAVNCPAPQRRAVEREEVVARLGLEAGPVERALGLGAVEARGLAFDAAARGAVERELVAREPDRAGVCVALGRGGMLTGGSGLLDLVRTFSETLS